MEDQVLARSLHPDKELDGYVVCWNGARGVPSPPRQLEDNSGLKGPRDMSFRDRGRPTHEQLLAVLTDTFQTAGKLAERARMSRPVTREWLFNFALNGACRKETVMAGNGKPMVRYARNLDR